MSVELQIKFPAVIDSTIRSDYVDCGMKMLYSRLYGLQKKGGSVHLVAGSAFAKGCEVARRKHYEEGLDPDDAVVEGVLAAWQEYGDFEPPEKYLHKSPERVAYALVEYFTEYPMPTDRIQPYFRSNGKPAIEFEFSFPLETRHPESGDPLLYGGRLDLVGSYMSDLWVVDEKTATRLGPQWLKSFGLRGQLIGYCYAAHSFDLPVNGFIVRGISFLKDYYGHAEVIEVVPDYRLDMWREQLELDVENMVRDYNRGKFSYAFADACNAYGGCPYRGLCDKQDWQSWWGGSYEIDYWNPLERTQKKAAASG
jgi:hypothetical protein